MASGATARTFRGHPRSGGGPRYAPETSAPPAGCRGGPCGRPWCRRYHASIVEAVVAPACLGCVDTHRTRVTRTPVVVTHRARHDLGIRSDLQHGQAQGLPLHRPRRAPVPWTPTLWYQPGPHLPWTPTLWRGASRPGTDAPQQALGAALVAARGVIRQGVSVMGICGAGRPPLPMRCGRIALPQHIQATPPARNAEGVAPHSCCMASHDVVTWRAAGQGGFHAPSATRGTHSCSKRQARA